LISAKPFDNLPGPFGPTGNLTAAGGAITGLVILGTIGAAAAAGALRMPEGLEGLEGPEGPRPGVADRDETSADAGAAAPSTEAFCNPPARPTPNRFLRMDTNVAGSSATGL